MKTKALLIFCLLSLTIPVYGAVYRFTATGIIDVAFGTADAGVNTFNLDDIRPGDSFTYEVTFKESTIPNSSTTPYRGEYNKAITAVSGRVGGYSFSTNAGGITVDSFEADSSSYLNAVSVSHTDVDDAVCGKKPIKKDDFTLAPDIHGLLQSLRLKHVSLNLQSRYQPERFENNHLTNDKFNYFTNSGFTMGFSSTNCSENAFVYGLLQSYSIIQVAP